MLTLDELAHQHQTDKASGRHGFASIYEQFVGPLRNRAVVVIEIGVKHGASVRMWRDYFPQGRIYGIDITPAAADHAGDRIEVFVGPQGDAAVMDAALAASGPPDLVIDDGSHRYPDQRASLLHLWPHLKRGGIYVMEDTHTSYAARYDMGYGQRESTIEMLKGAVDDVHFKLHEHAPMLAGVADVHFYRGTCVLRKR